MLFMQTCDTKNNLKERKGKEKKKRKNNLED